MSRACAFIALLQIPAFGVALAAPGATGTTTTASGAPHRPASPPKRVTTVEGITEYQLPNGLRVLLFPDPSKPTITVNMTYLVGSRHENYGETGMAHLLEHMVFKGTPKHPNIPQELTEHGCRPNGSTWWDRTNYFETFRASDENLRWALDLEADRMVNSFIARKDLDSEMTVVRNEFEAGENQPLSILEERTIATAFLWHSYGKSTIGARSDIENVPIDRLQAFYRRYYQPDNAVLLVAGNFDEAKTLALVSSTFGRIPKPTRVLQPIYTIEPVQDGERSVTLRRVGDVQGLCLVYHTAPGPHPDSAALDLLLEVLSDTPSGRLHKALVETKKAARISGTSYALHDAGMFVLSAEVRQDAPIEAARLALESTVEGLAQTPVTDEEVERARAKILKSIALTLNQADRVGLELSEWLGMGDWRLFFLHRDRVRKVSAGEVNAVAATYLKRSNSTLGTFLPTAKPDRSEIPASPLVADLLRDYKGDAATAVGESFDASPQNIDARTSRFQAPNGLKVALLPKKTRGATVVGQLTMRYGDEKSLFDRSTAAELVGPMLLRGTARHTRQQIRDELDRLQTRLGISSSPTQTQISIETVKANLPEVLGLVGEVLREPVFPESEFEQLRQEELSDAEQERTDPQALATIEFRRALNPYPKGDPRYVATVDEEVADLRAAKLEEVKQFHATFFGTSHAELALVGDFDAPQTTKLVTDVLGGLTSAQPFARVPSLYQDVPAANRSLETPDKANAMFLAGMNLKLRDDAPDYPALVLGNYMLGGGFLNSRLATRLRQKEGLSYGAGSQLSASPLDQSGGFTAYAIYAPENVKKLETAFNEEVHKVLADGFRPDEVEAAKSGWLQSRQVTRAQDTALARTLATNLFIDRTLGWDGELDAKVRALTPEQVVAAMKRHLDPAKLVYVKAGDFAKGAVAATAAPAAALTK